MTRILPDINHVSCVTACLGLGRDVGDVMHVGRRRQLRALEVPVPQRCRVGVSGEGGGEGVMEGGREGVREKREKRD